eukprot:2587211-Pyramimonas_sp.AAC.1
MALSTGPTDEGENVQEGGWTASSVLALAYGCFFLPAINNFLTPKLRGKHRTVQGRRWKVDYPGLGLVESVGWVAKLAYVHLIEMVY